MKMYKKDDKVIDIGTVTDVLENGVWILWDEKNEPYYFSNEDVDEFFTPAPKWRDGAVEYPNLSGWKLARIYGMSKVDKILISWTLEEISNWKDEQWHDYVWMYQREFEKLLPAMPEPEIKPCPFCGGIDLMLDNNGTGNYEPEQFWLYCENADCNYVSGAKETEQEAIKAHNALCEKVQNEREV